MEGRAILLGILIGAAGMYGYFWWMRRRAVS